MYFELMGKMSCFSGRIKELHNILVDNFSRFDSYTCFFLSHCHSDHMTNVEFLLSTIGKKSNVFLYCSPISRIALMKKFNINDDSVIKELTTSTVINVPESDELPGYQVLVTPIPAGHCAGALMFLFEAVNMTILYTGDMRINKNDILKFKPLHSNNYVKKIDKLYFDSTFLNEKYWHFPARSEVAVVLIKLIQNWLMKKSTHQVLLKTSALLGYEFLFIEIEKKLKYQIHVNDFLYQFFSYVPEVGNALTNNCQNTRIHAFNMKSKMCLNRKDLKNVLIIKLSSQWYRSPKGTVPKPLCKKITEQNIQICYATHCSCSELVEILNYLQPGEVESCTSTVGSSEKNKTLYLQQIINSWPIKKGGENPKLGEDNYLLKINHKIR